MLGIHADFGCFDTPNFPHLLDDFPYTPTLSFVRTLIASAEIPRPQNCPWIMNIVDGPQDSIDRSAGCW